MPQIVVVGSFVQDLAFKTESFPKPGETRLGLFSPGAGGKGFNQAVACNRLGLDTLFVGALGNDAFALTARNFAEKEGLKTRFQICPDHATGAASITVNKTGENLIVVALGANGQISEETIESVRADVENASVMLCQLEVNLDATRKALSLARETGTLSILNTAPINAETSIDLLKLADIITPNETEFAYLYEKFNDELLDDFYWSSSDEELHDLCRSLKIPIVVITLGGEGCFVSIGSEKATSHCLSGGARYKRFQAVEASVLDTTGAGDAFNGGLAAGLCLFDMKLEEALIYATKVGGLSVEKPGTANSMPTDKDVTNRFSKH